MESRGSKFEDLLVESDGFVPAGPSGEWNGYALTRGSCGDEIEIWIRTKEGVVVDAACRVKGCLPSRICTYSAVELARGKRVEEAELVSPRDILGRLDLPEDAEHCAVLAVEALQAALKTVRSNGEGGRSS